MQRISNQHRDAFEKKSAQRVNELELQLHFAERARRRLLRNYNICNSLILMYIPCAAPRCKKRFRKMQIGAACLEELMDEELNEL